MVPERVFLIAGGSRGIGRALEEELRARRWRGWTISRTGSGPEHLSLDLREPEAPDRIRALLAEKAPFGIQFLAVCAGDPRTAPLAELSSEDLRAQFDSNVVTAHHALLGAREALARGAPAQALLCGLEDPLAGRRKVAAHAAAKAALLSLGNSWALELEPKRVRVRVWPITFVSHPDADPLAQQRGIAAADFARKVLDEIGL
ncbi:MAG: SDR family NAD(P)-dependent oxidoreductase [Planctomycetota bacterium]|nr:MAG: SDR family NAD(P)-dependent oxidoreductase [Planctomycetota bacterium]